MLGDSRIRDGNWKVLLHSKHIANLGIGGDKAYCICKRMEIIKNTRAKICFIEGGVMDLYTESPDSIFNSFSSMVSVCRQNNIIPVVNAIVKINSKAPPYYKLANAKIDSVNNLLYNYSHQNHLDYIDLNGQAVDKATQTLKNEFTVDGSHFNEKFYLLWAKHINDLLLKYKIGYL